MRTENHGARLIKTALVLGVLAYIAAGAGAEVVRVDVTKRSDVGTSGYEKIVGTIHFAVWPSDPRDAVIVDLDKAPTNANGQVEFSSDLYVLRPKDPARSNGVALIEVSIRGRKSLLNFFSRAGSGGTDPSADADLGDGFLTNQGYSLVSVGWQFDVDRQGGSLKLDAPVAKGVSCFMRSQFTPDRRTNQATLAELAGYSLDATSERVSLAVRDGPFEESLAIPRARWSLRGNTVTLADGFEPGRTYELAVRASDPPVAGIGLAAFRDTASWLKYGRDALSPVRFVYAYGASQSGRFLRTFLYYGFNSDEKGRKVLDGVLAHAAGGAGLSINERGAQPNGGNPPSPAFPFADKATRDPITGRVEGLLDNDRARKNQPKIFYTNTATEYWSGDRFAAFVHTTPDGKSDVTPPPNVRVYFLAGAQHFPARFPPSTTRGQQPDNPLEYVWTMRALLISIDRWVRHGIAPPASQYPHLADGTLVPATKLSFPTIPGVQSPQAVDGPHDGTRRLPFLVPAVDGDGNERCGVRTAEQAVPVATFTGWNFRNSTIGASGRLLQRSGSAILFSKTPAERNNGDSRSSIIERYQSKDRYLAQARAHCDKLVEAGFLLASDVPQAMKRVSDWWQVATNGL